MHQTTPHPKSCYLSLLWLTYKEEGLELHIRVELLHDRPKVCTMDPQLIEDLDQQVPQNDALPDAARCLPHRLHTLG